MSIFGNGILVVHFVYVKAEKLRALLVCVSVYNIQLSIHFQFSVLNACFKNAENAFGLSI